MHLYLDSFTLIEYSKIKNSEKKQKKSTHYVYNLSQYKSSCYVKASEVFCLLYF